MKEVFATIYELLISVYGDNLAGYLFGFCNNGDGGLYSQIGLSLVFVTLGVAILYYFVIANAKRFKRKYWFAAMGIAALISGFLGFYLPFLDLDRGLVCPQYVFTAENAVFLGLITCIYSAFLFFISSLGLRYIGNKSARYTPF